MTTIYIETIPKGNNLFDLIHTIEIDGKAVSDDVVKTDGFDDRMIAAMTNLGLACRYLVDNRCERGEVCIVSDKDGKDHRYGSEHDYLYEAVHSHKDYQENRTKYALFWTNHVKYLDRIREYADIWELQITCRGLYDTVSVEEEKILTMANIVTTGTVLIDGFWIDYVECVICKERFHSKDWQRVKLSKFHKFRNYHLGLHTSKQYEGTQIRQTGGIAKVI